jgi:hypothetical protein
VTQSYKAQRARQSGAQITPQEASIPYIIEAGFEFKIANDDLQMYKGRAEHEHGSVQRAFQNTDNSEFLILFEDLSLQYFANGKKVWTKDQALSKVTQVEIFDTAYLSDENAFSDTPYVRHMHEPVTWAQVPTRIMQRYVENAQYLINQVQRLFSPKDVT